MNSNDLLKSATFAFVMPHFSDGDPSDIVFLDKAVESIRKQDDANWILFIIDDCSPSERAKEHLLSISKMSAGKINVFFADKNTGPGHCRNIGIDAAANHKCPVILFLDSDDFSYHNRLTTVRNIYCNNPDIDVIYSSFNVIDENDTIVPENCISPSIKEIIDCHLNSPPEGADAWIEMLTRTGYANLTSTTAVKTHIASKFPFPVERVSEDYNTWVRYSAGGAKFYFSQTHFSDYRVCQSVNGSATRVREGRETFYLQKAKFDLVAFNDAMQVANQIHPMNLEQKIVLKCRFHVKLADTLLAEGFQNLAREQVKIAFQLSENETRVHAKHIGFKFDEMMLISV